METRIRKLEECCETQEIQIGYISDQLRYIIAQLDTKPELNRLRPLAAPLKKSFAGNKIKVKYMKQSKSRKQSKKRRSKQTKRGGGCGVLNPNKSYSDNRRNCLKNKDAWNTLRKTVNGAAITCKRDQVQDTNFPSDPACTSDIVDKEFNPTLFDDDYDGKNGLMR